MAIFLTPEDKQKYLDIFPTERQPEDPVSIAFPKLVINLLIKLIVAITVYIFGDRVMSLLFLRRHIVTIFQEK